VVPRRLDRGSRAAHSWDMMTGVLNIHSVPALRLGLIGGDALDATRRSLDRKPAIASCTRVDIGRVCACMLRIRRADGVVDTP